MNGKLKRSIRAITEEESLNRSTSTTSKPADDAGEKDIDTLFTDEFDLDLDASFSLNCDDIEFECKSDHRCIPIESYCDGKIDCDDESDETMCASTPAIHFSLIDDTTSTTTTTTTEKSTTLPLIVNTTIAPTTMNPLTTKVLRCNGILFPMISRRKRIHCRVI